ncbi:MAG: RNA methyltransferase PUA domain-containing protein, partial [Pseudomonadota bacterium]
MSTIHRLHVSDELALGAEIELETAQAHYLQRVLRLDVGASIRLFNGRDGEWLAEILTAHRGRVLVT